LSVEFENDNISYYAVESISLFLLSVHSSLLSFIQILVMKPKAQFLRELEKYNKDKEEKT
jgi:hypothetical protein